MSSRLTYSRTLAPWVLVLCLGALGGAPSAWAGMRAGDGFSSRERALLEAGELVARPRNQRKGRLELSGGTSYQVIDAPPRVVWDALLDTASYRHTMPRVLEARVVGQRPDGRGRTVFIRQGARGLIERSYYLDLQLDEARRDITFVIDASRPHDVKAAWGFYTVRPYGGGRTLLSYGVMADVGGGLLERIAGDQVRDWMLRPPQMLKGYVERFGR